MRAALGRWWRAPSPLDLLVGEEGYARAVILGFAQFSTLTILVGIPAIVLTNPEPRPFHLFAAFTVGFPWAIGVVAIAQASRLRRGVIYVAVVLSAGLVGWWIGVLIEELLAIMIVPPIAVVIVTVWLPRRWAVAATTAGSGAFYVTALIRHVPELASSWVPVTAFSYLILVILSLMLDRVQRLAAQERSARAEVERLVTSEREAREALADLNATLEDRVRAQVGEIEGLGRLRQFLSPQVADAVVTDSLVPHRQQIAVVFCDLRGFTSFSYTSEPEELLDVLHAYYEAVGTKLHEYGATVGSFQGDGILAYFNDPVPCEDPAGTAITMALMLRKPLDDLCALWARRGFDLGYGMGIAFGYATLGTIGFEGRLDYTPLGSVVNLASRLGDEADWGEILVDGRALHAVEGRVEAEARTLDLKGFGDALPAYRITAAPGLPS